MSRFVHAVAHPRPHLQVTIAAKGNMKRLNDPLSPSSSFSSSDLGRSLLSSLHPTRRESRARASSIKCAWIRRRWAILRRCHLQGPIKMPKRLKASSSRPSASSHFQRNEPQPSGSGPKWLRNKECSEPERSSPWVGRHPPVLARSASNFQAAYHIKQSETASVRLPVLRHTSTDTMTCRWRMVQICPDGLEAVQMQKPNHLKDHNTSRVTCGVTCEALKLILPLLHHPPPRTLLLCISSLVPVQSLGPNTGPLLISGSPKEPAGSATAFSFALRLLPLPCQTAPTWLHSLLPLLLLLRLHGLTLSVHVSLAEEDSEIPLSQPSYTIAVPVFSCVNSRFCLYRHDVACISYEFERASYRQSYQPYAPFLSMLRLLRVCRSRCALVFSWDLVG